MILGAAGNVGAYALQMALDAGLNVVAVGRARDAQLLHSLEVESIVDSDAPNFERELSPVDAILDTVGAGTLERCLGALKRAARRFPLFRRNRLRKGQRYRSSFSTPGHHLTPENPEHAI